MAKKIYEVRADVELRFEVEAEEGRADDEAWAKAERLLEELGIDFEVNDVRTDSYFGPFEVRVPAAGGEKRWRVLRLVAEDEEGAAAEAAKVAAKLPGDQWDAAGVTVERHRVL